MVKIERQLFSNNIVEALKMQQKIEIERALKNLKPKTLQGGEQG